MRRSEAALLVLIMFLVAWIFISLAHPLAGLFILYSVFAVLLGFFILMIAGIIYSKRK